MWKKHKETIFLTVVFFLFIFIRSLNFSYNLNWSQDQADCAIAALEIFRTKKLTLIGPQISATFDGRLIFQGPATYYFFLVFLTLGGWDPIKASYIFMIFAGLMIFPLYHGTKKLINQKAGWIMVLLYAFLTYYINYTRFLWNSTLQLSLVPILIWLISKYEKKQRKIWFFLVSFWLGFLFQFHYQFALVIFGFAIYYIFFKKISVKDFLVFVGGLALGFSPLILFELKHGFYNIKTMLLFVQNWDKVDRPGNMTMPHYYLTLSFIFLFVFLSFFKKYLKKISDRSLIFFGVLIFIFGLVKNIQKPAQSYWAPGPYWNYPMEKKAYDIISSTNIKSDFNVADLSYYNTTATVIKYFLKRDHVAINYDDYYNNKYLFVISHGKEYEKVLSYEVAFFKPRKKLGEWPLNNYYDLFLFEKIK